MDLDGNREAQRRLYGAPLGELLGGYADRLGLTQARLAALLGVSPPMLSQLMNARRIKIGNPVAAQRLQLLHDLVPEVESGAMDVDQLAATVESTQGADVLTRTSTRTSVRERVSAVQEVFREAASAADFLDAAATLEATHPRIAELLRVYGAERTVDAIAHHEAHARG